MQDNRNIHNIVLMDPKSLVILFGQIAKFYNQDANYSFINPSHYNAPACYDGIEHMLHLIKPAKPFRLFALSNKAEYNNNVFVTLECLSGFNKYADKYQIKIYKIPELKIDSLDPNQKGKITCLSNLAYQPHKEFDLFKYGYTSFDDFSPKGFPNANLFWHRFTTIANQNQNNIVWPEQQPKTDKRVNIVFVEGKTDAMFWRIMALIHNADDRFVFIPCGGTSVVFFANQTVKMLEKLKPQADFKLFGLFDYDKEGKNYRKLINSHNPKDKKYKIKAFTLMSLNLFQEWLPDKINITIENLYSKASMSTHEVERKINEGMFRYKLDKININKEDSDVIWNRFISIIEPPKYKK